jgi:iron complex outermembrane receptor protein
MHFKKILAAGLPVLACLHTLAQSPVRGKVTDLATGEPLQGVVISFPELHSGTITDSAGNYSLKRLPAGKFLMQARYPGYKSLITEVNLDTSTVFDFVLAPAVTELDEVIITGVSSASRRRFNPVPVHVTGKEQIAMGSHNNIIECLASQPGVALISTGNAIAKPVIRGLSHNRVLVLYNGMRQEGQQWGDEHGVEVDAYSIERAEISFGAGNIMYGPDAMGGVINLVTFKPLNEGEISGEALAEYHTNTGLAGFSVMQAGNLGGISWSLRASSKDAGNYHNRMDGFVHNTAFWERNLTAAAGISRKWGTSMLHLSTFNQRIGLPEGVRDSAGNFMQVLADGSYVTVPSTTHTSYTINGPSQNVSHHRMLWTNQFVLDKSRVNFNAGAQLNERKEFEHTTGKDDYSLYFNLPTLTAEIRLAPPTIRGWKTIVGATWMQQWNNNRGPEAIIPEYALHDGGVYAQGQRQSEKLNIVAAIRYDLREVMAQQRTEVSDTLTQLRFVAREFVFSNVSATCGAALQATDNLLIRVNISRGFRTPNLPELTSNGKHEGSFRYELGNASLEAETTLQADMGFEFSSEHLTIQTAVFLNSIRNYIYLRKLAAVMGGDSVVDTSDPVQAFGFVQDDAVLYGGEIATDFHPHPLDWLHIENSFSTVNGELAQSHQYLPLTPPARLQTELRAVFKKWGKIIHAPFLRFQIGHYMMQDRYLAENGTETLTPAYTLFHAGIGCSLKSRDGRERIQLVLNATNLTDKIYQSHLNRLKYAPVNPLTGTRGIFDMGRNFSVKLIVPLLMAPNAR